MMSKSKESSEAIKKTDAFDYCCDCGLIVVLEVPCSCHLVSILLSRDLRLQMMEGIHSSFLVVVGVDVLTSEEACERECMLGTVNGPSDYGIQDY